MLTKENAVLVIVDVQPNLLGVIHEKEALTSSLVKLVKGAKALDIPIIVTEQYPERLGETIPEIASLVPEVIAIPKLSFSCCREKAFTMALKAIGRRQILLTGIETHICVYQTARDLICNDYEVEIVADCVSSRKLSDREIGLKKMLDKGAAITSVETALFELLRIAEGPVFKEISKIVK